MSKIKVGDRVIRTRPPEDFNYRRYDIEYRGIYTVEDLMAGGANIVLEELPDGENVYSTEYFEKVDDEITQISENYNI